MKEEVLHIDKSLLIPYAREAYMNIGSALFEICNQDSGLKTSGDTDIFNFALFRDCKCILPEQKVSLQKDLLNILPSLKIILDYKTESLARKKRIAQASYLFPHLIAVLKRIIEAINCICNEQAIDSCIISYAKAIIEAAPNSIRNSYKYNCYKDTPSLLPELALSFFFKSKFLKGPDRQLNPNWFFSPVLISQNGEKRLSDIGKILLISLFISHDRVYEFLKATGLLKRFDGVATPPCLSQRQIVHEIFSCYSIRKPHKIPTVLRESKANAIEIIHYLRKSPEELYPILPVDKQAEFVVFDSLNRKVFMRRFNDGFPNLAIEYFDSNSCFKNIRFGIHVGYQSNKKHKGIYADGIERDRYVKYNINCFSTIKEAYDYLQSLKGKLGDIHEEKISYIRNGENFALSIGDKLPEIKEERVRCSQPDCWISKYDLEAMAFLEYLCPGKAELIIQKEIEGQKNFASGNKKEKDPEGIKKILAKETDELLDDIANKKKIVLKGNLHLGAKRYCRLYSNGISEFLMKDIIFWLYPSQKPTGLQFAVVRSILANFDGIQYNISDIKKALNKICGNEDKHVILRSIREANDILDFYERYLHSRRAFLNSSECIKVLSDLLRKEHVHNRHVRPVLLPRHIFFAPILTALTELYNEPSLNAIIDKAKREQIYSLGYIVKAYFKIIHKDQSQKMYISHRRDQYGLYRLLANNPEYTNIVRLSKEDKKNIILMTDNKRHRKRTVSSKEVFLSEFSLTKKHMLETERAIRRHRVNDIILFLLSQKRLNKDIPGLKLESITSKGEWLQQVVTQKIITKIGEKEITINYNSTLGDSDYLFRWLSEPKLQRHIEDNIDQDGYVSLTAEDICKMFNCKLHAQI